MKYLAVMILIFCAIFIPMGNELPVLIILVLFGAMLPISTITYDTTARWDKYAVSLPMTRKEIVGTRYQLMLGGVCVAGFVSLIIAVAMTVLLPGKGVFVTFMNPLALTVIFVACGIFLGSIMLPLTLKFGPEKMRYLFIMVYGAAFLLILGLTFLLDVSGTVLPTSVAMPMILGVLVAAAAVVVYVSYRISVRIYTNTEF